MSSGTRSNRTALLDVNVLIALFNPDHVHHEIAHDWFAEHHTQGWATCPLTENGFVRVLGSPSNGMVSRLRAPDLIERLQTFCTTRHHVFWPDAVSIRDAAIFNAGRLAGHRQVPDIYLLGLARKMGGTLVTFDRSIPKEAVVGASRSTLTVLSPDDESSGRHGSESAF
jgi:toxin-antitoxin system PIN domain toxin